MTVYEIITQRIVEQLEKGKIPWHKPWTGTSPKNLISKKDYRGINIFLLSTAQYTNPYWITFKQCKDLGGSIKKDEKGTPVIYWNWLDIKNNEEDIEKHIPFLKYYTVFNAEQCEGIETPEIKTFEWDTIVKCEAVVEDIINKPEIEYEGNRACYISSQDKIKMPERKYFVQAEKYYSTLFHELGHSTGHWSRLNRDTIVDLCPFGSTNYSKEKLVAEMTASFLCSYTGIENNTLDNSTAYIQGWVRQFRDKPKMVIMAAAQAQKAADYLLNVTHQN
ncbi:MAG: ArdC-like ssDNA-binding domain-containing protein [bacterium]